MEEKAAGKEVKDLLTVKELKALDLLTVKELKALDPTKDDQAIEAELQVKAIRNIYKEKVSALDLLLVSVGNMVLTLGALLLVFSPNFPRGDGSRWFILIPLAVVLFTQFGSPWLFESTRIVKQCSKRLKLASRIAAYGAAYRSPYNLNLTEANLSEMMSYGKTKALNSSGTEYNIIVDNDEGSYVMIYRTED